MVRMHPVAGKEKAVMICRAFAEGAPKGADCDVFYGVNETNAKQWHEAQKRGNWFYIDNSAFDKVRGVQYRIAHNRVQVDPRNVKSDGKRFEALGLDIKPWKLLDKHWLAVEQSPSFMKWVAQDLFWFGEYLESIPSSHSTRRRPWSPNKPKQAATLQADLAWASRLVTHSSAAAVEAVMVGVQVIVSPMSALYRMTCARGDMAHRDERRKFLSVLADNQGTLEEFRSGEMWVRLNRPNLSGADR